MRKIAELLNQDFESSSGKTPEFKSFARKFKNALQKELDTIGAKITSYNTGHFYVSGFFRVGESNKCYYFSLPDVRGGSQNNNMMYRTATGEKDYTGGSNQWVDIESGMAKRMRLA